jgi:hypothetical protein
MQPCYSTPRTPRLRAWGLPFAFGLLAMLANRGLGAAELHLPDFEALERRATDSVNISMGPFMLQTAARLMHDQNPDDTALGRILGGITCLEIHSFQFAEDFAYAESDLDAVRRQVAGPEWTPLVAVRDHRQHEKVDIRMRTDHARPSGLVLIASEPREFTILVITGKFRAEDVPQLERGLHLFGESSDRGPAQAVAAPPL